MVNFLKTTNCSDRKTAFSDYYLLRLSGGESKSSPSDSSGGNVARPDDFVDYLSGIRCLESDAVPFVSVL